jgi:protein phosphatase
VRENNEDKFDFYEPEDPALLAARGSLFAVGDGIGGAQAGQIASEMMLKLLISTYYDDGKEDISGALIDAVSAANDRIYHLAKMIPERNGMGTTLTAAIFVEDRVVIAQVGDSRAYLIRDQAVTQVSQDHSWVEENVRAGLMSRSDAENSPFRNVITRSVGAAPEVQPDLFEEECRAGDIWVLCSDGLTGYVQDAEILKIAGSHAPSEAARQFIELANARGGRDNITVFVVAVRAIVPGESACGQVESQSPSTAADSSAEAHSAAQVNASESGNAPIVSPDKSTLTGLRKLFGR